MRELLGILGGMGPLASAEFLKTIYEFNLPGLEQDSPGCVLYSDPTFPDRTETILHGSDELLLNLLKERLAILSGLDVSRIVIACITSHHFLPRLPSHFTDKIISLVDLIVDEVIVKRKRCLLLCSNGTREAKIFERHDRWPLAAEYIVLPDKEDQTVVHDLIYQLKQNGSCDAAVARLSVMTEKYDAAALIAGCTEFHLLTKHLMNEERDNCDFQMIDPLLSLARDLPRLVDEKNYSVVN